MFPCYCIYGFHDDNLKLLAVIVKELAQLLQVVSKKAINTDNSLFTCAHVCGI